MRYITIFVDVVANGGNLLLDIGPKEDGYNTRGTDHVLKTLGAWNKKHSEAIFNTVAGIPPRSFLWTHPLYQKIQRHCTCLFTEKFPVR
jgi:alpha-L-fucosidase